MTQKMKEKSGFSDASGVSDVSRLPDASGLFLLLCPVLLVLLILLDQVTKWLAAKYLQGGNAISLIPGILELTYLENRGIAWGMFQGKLPFFLIFTIVFFLLMCLLFVRIPRTRYFFPFAVVVTGLTAGAAGNFIDRAFRGYVIDFIYVSLIDFPVFNVADICVVLSGIALVLLVCFRYQEQDFAFLCRKGGQKDT